MNKLAAVIAQGTKGEINLQPEDSNFGNVMSLTPGDLVGGFIRLALIIAALVFFFILVVGGIRWIVSGGDKTHTEQARGQITAALVGLVIVFAAWAIAQLIGTFFGINIFQLQLPSL